MKSSALIKKGCGGVRVETPKICRWCLSANHASKALMRGDSGQYKLQKIFDFTRLQINLVPGVPSYLCTLCEGRLKKMDRFRWRCNEKNDMVERFIKQQNTAKNGADISKVHLGHSAEQTACTELSIKPEVNEPDVAHDLHLNQRTCTVPHVNGTHECCGNQPFAAEENPITIKLEYVDVDEQYRLQTNAIVDHEQDNLQTNPLGSVYQDREDHSLSSRSISNNICGDGSELLIKTEVTTPDTAKDLHLNQKRTSTVHQANSTYECYNNKPDDLFKGEENQTAIKLENEDVDEQHQLQTTNDVHQCPHCSSRFTKAYILTIHIRKHTGEKPYVCKVCDKAFHAPGNLTNHSKIHQPTKKQPHQCPHCSLNFLWLSALNTHMRTHTGERPYVCKVCDKAFYSQFILAEHSKIHDKDQMHQCPYCSSSFPWLSSLKNHIRIHTGEKPYVCKVCDKAFSSTTSRALHSKIHRNNQNQ